MRGLYAYIIRRLILLIPVTLGVMLITFILIHSIPGNPIAYLGGSGKLPPDAVAKLVKIYGLDQPLFVQFFLYLANIFQGNLGTSISVNPGASITDLILTAFPHTVELTIYSSIIMVLVGIPAGVISAKKRNSLTDNVTRVGALIGVSMPVFWLGIMLQIVFGVAIPIFPLLWAGIHEPAIKATGIYLIDGFLSLDFRTIVDSIMHYALPSIALGALSLSIVTRMVRSSMLEVLGEDYIRTARAKGCSENATIYRHALRNSLLPATTVIGLQIGGLLGGAVLTETVFAIPGVGRLITDAILKYDYPLVMAGVLFIAIIYIIANLVVDVLYAYLDPRIRY
ncbi:MAG: ABC transporter permease [Candidatus Odinarchaeum yellowstonii]|uniref:ABC transporter permease n=1 Tax=Odinarchaeota yellowstonii (strain LCB_4) TaxID=1841599 RepID=A0AAF0D2G6_ODILC|nr:MAG: ABC transporter permease [Candidatus Odinarchaeum yellowstonii]